MFNCPLTGQVCNEVRTFVISEKVGEFTQTTNCCRKCSAHYVDYRNKVAWQQATQMAEHQNAMAAQNQAVNLPEVLSELLGINPQDGKVIIQKLTIPAAEQAEVLKCGKCGSTTADINKTNKFGCPECYKAFDKQIANGIGNAQKGGTKHVGKIPGKHAEIVFETPNKAEEIPLDTEQYILFLKGQMDQLIKEEQYEKAAQCRDLIIKLGGNPKQSEGSCDVAG